MKKAIRMGLIGVTLLSGTALRASAQETVTFEQMVAEIASDDVSTRLRAVRALKQAAYPESAGPLARAILDTDDAVQAEAIDAELNVYLAEKITPKSRKALIVEVRNRIAAEPIFAAGPSAIDPRPVPAEVLSALRQAIRDDNGAVALEATYAFGALAANAHGRERQQLLAESASELAAGLGVSSADMRTASLRVIARLYAWRPGDGPVDQTLGDAVIGLLNDRQSSTRIMATQALGALRYERGVQSLSDLWEHYGRNAAGLAAFDALARIAHPSSRSAFLENLSTREPRVKQLAIEGLARSRDASEAAHITEAVSGERDERVLLAAQFASVMLSNGSLDALVGALGRPRTHDAAAEYLATAAAGRVSVLAPYLQTQDARSRADLLEALGLSGDPQALPTAQRLVQDPDPVVARTAARAVARLQANASR